MKTFTAERLAGVDPRRFWSKVNRRGRLPDQSKSYYRGLGQCHEWTHALTSAGYGQINVGGRPLPAHRVSWVLSKGGIPDGKHVLHRCDNPMCVNPDHLFLGTPKDNATDRTTKGRTASGEAHGSVTKPESTVRGEQHFAALLTENDVLEIRRLYAETSASAKKLAKIFRVNPVCIQKIIAFRSWSHVGGYRPPTFGPDWVATKEVARLTGISHKHVTRKAIQVGARMKYLKRAYGGSLVFREDIALFG